MRIVALLAAAAIVLGASPAGAATLIHAYDFSGSTVTDSVGTEDGTLLAGATVSGGLLHLDGSDDYVEFGADLVPAAGNEISVFVRLQATPNPGTYTEVISQGGSFYFGTAPGGGNFMRIGDTFCCTSVVFPSGQDFHGLLLTIGAGGTDFWIDGTNVFHSATAMNYGGGTPTRFGRQYGPHAEYLQGQYDTVRIFSGVATYAEASATPGSGGVPEPATWALMIGGFAGAGAILRRRRSLAAA